MHVCIKYNASMYDMMGKELTYGNQMVLAIIFPFHNLLTRKNYGFYNFC